MCGSEGDSEAWIERGLYAARLDMVRVHDVLGSAHVVMESVDCHKLEQNGTFFLEIDRTAALFLIKAE